MTEPENFLARWSRRKLDAKEPEAPAGSEAPAQKPVADADEGGKGAPAAGAATNPGPVFDPASLPSLDSIGANTDISAFLQAGVPGDLRLAALRRAWVSDPAIRDFKGLAENDWDFTVPNEAMGFGDIDPGLDVKKMLANVFGEAPRTKPEAAETPSAAEQSEAAQDQENVTPGHLGHSDEAALRSNEEPAEDQHFESEMQIVRRNNDAAMHADDEHNPDDSFQKHKRRAGGALPQ